MFLARRSRVAIARFQVRRPPSRCHRGLVCSWPRFFIEGLNVRHELLRNGTGCSGTLYRIAFLVSLLAGLMAEVAATSLYLSRREESPVRLETDLGDVGYKAMEEIEFVIEVHNVSARPIRVVGTNFIDC